MKSWYPEDVLTFCPSCGTRGFEPSDRTQQPIMHLHCSSCGFGLFINAAASVVVLIEKQPGLLLMTRRLKEPEQGTLDLPGGFIDPGERAEDAAAREVFEECGLRVRDLKLQNRTYCNQYRYGGLTYYTLDLVFTCSAENWDELSEDGDEVETLLIQKEHINPSDVGFVSVRNIVLDYLQGRIFTCGLGET